MDIPDYELLRRIGKGSYGEVWLARSATGQWRAVKIVRRESFEEDHHYEREFRGLRDYEPVSRGHDGLIDVLHVGRDDNAGSFYYVMELADPRGGDEIDPETYQPRTLSAELKDGEPLPLTDCLAAGQVIAEALAHLHERGLVHRDLKPGNIVYVDGQPRLADPGLVTAMSRATSLVGTLGYLPPEGPGRPAADIYGLGKVLYETATGMDRQAFPELPEAARGPEWTTAHRHLNRVTARACASIPEERYPDATQLAEELAAICQGRAPRHTRSPMATSTKSALAAGFAMGMLFLLIVAGNYPAETTSTKKPEATARPVPHLVAHYQLDGNALDAAGANHGKIHGATPAPDRHGNPTGAMRFDGIDDYIHMAKSLPDMKSMTVTAWIKLEGNTTGTIFADIAIIPHNDTLMVVSPKGIGIRADRGGAFLGHNTIPSNINGPSWLDWNIPLRQWIHVAWVMQPEKSTVWLNGRKVRVVELTGRTWDSSTTFSRWALGWITLNSTIRSMAAWMK